MKRALVFLCAVVAAGADEPPGDAAVASGVVERTGVRLLQVDVSLSGPADIAARLDEEDFEVLVRGDPVEKFFVDGFCDDPAPEQGKPDAAAPVPSPFSLPTTFLFYFDQPHTTTAGRRHGIEVARDLIPRLLDGGARIMVVSSARDLRVFAPLTADGPGLDAALDRLEKEPVHVETAASEEERRLGRLDARIRRTLDQYKWGLRMGGSRARLELRAALHSLLAEIRSFQREDAQRARQSLERLRWALARLGPADPPKVLVYFADTLRSAAGRHYMDHVHRSVDGRKLLDLAERVFENDPHQNPFRALGVEADRGGDPEGVEPFFLRTLDEAAAQGVRVYTVEAEGLAHPSARRSQARDTLSTLALETGGRAFLRGVDSERIGRRLRSDLSCVYVVSFEPADLPVGDPLRVDVRVARDGVDVHGRGRVVVQDERARLTSRVMAAHFDSESGAAERSLSVGLVPEGCGKDDCTALLQVVAPGLGYRGGTWEMSAFVLRGDRVRHRVSGRIRVSAPGVPVILEDEIVLPRGEVRVVATAHELVADEVYSTQETLAWPKASAGVAAGPVAVLQPTPGAFARDGVVRESSFLVHGERDPLRPERATAVVSLVCRSAESNEAVRVERSLEGEAEVSFDPLRIEFGEDRCVQTRDFIPPETMGPGWFRYTARVVSDDGDELARAEKVFSTHGPPVE